MLLVSWTKALGSEFDRYARERGKAYEREGRVHLLPATDHEVAATVLGGDEYHVFVERTSATIRQSNATSWASSGRRLARCWTGSGSSPRRPRPAG